MSRPNVPAGVFSFFFHIGMMTEGGKGNEFKIKQKTHTTQGPGGTGAV